MLRSLLMTLPYGFAKATVTGDPWLKPSPGPRETQYHVHSTLDVAGNSWDVAINVGTDDADDLLVYKLVYDFHHPFLSNLSGAPMGRNDLAGTTEFPALDFQRSDVLSETGGWRASGVMDGTISPEPVASIARLLSNAKISSTSRPKARLVGPRGGCVCTATSPSQQRTIRDFPNTWQLARHVFWLASCSLQYMRSCAVFM